MAENARYTLGENGWGTLAATRWGNIGRKLTAIGTPCLPFRSHRFLLPPQIQIDELEIISITWDTLPGKYYIYPTQNTSMEDSTFELPNSLIYSSSDPWPEIPIEMPGQSGMMGVGVAAVTVTPVRYIPSDSLLLVLSTVQVTLDIGPRQFEVLSPQRETEWSAERRNQGILSFVDNPGDHRMYGKPQLCRDSGESGPLTITEIPSANGDGVDFIIITSEDLEDDWQQLADLRIRQGIITVVKTVEWIEAEYSGFDTQEQIKNFIIDAYDYWGTSMVLLGGDDQVVPARLCKELGTSSSYGYPCDDYYVDVDDVGDWYSTIGDWVPPSDYLIDLCIGRVPVDNSDMVETFLHKLDLYEDPVSLPEDFARQALFLGDSDDTTPEYAYETAADDFETFNEDLTDDGIAGEEGEYLDDITELYWPRYDPYEERWSSPVELSRNSALSELNDGYNIVFHCSHSGTHQMGAQAAEELTIRQYITENDVLNISNDGEPGILMSLGCWPGHFEGAECILERGLLTSDDSGFIGVLAHARSGWWSHVDEYFGNIIDALYYYSPISGTPQPAVSPSEYLGECYLYVVNRISSSDRYHFNLLGDPTMFVWRGNPIRPTITPNPATVAAGTFSVSITVREDGTLLPSAKVCLFKEDELFAISKTNSQGVASFTNIQVATPGTIDVTVIKRKQQSDIIHFLPGTSSITVQQSSQPLVVLNDLFVDDDDSDGSYGNDDGEVNPGETIQFDLVVENTGLQTARNTTATLSIDSGSEHIEEEIDMSENLGNIPAETEALYPEAFCIEIKDDVSSSADPVMMQVTLSHSSGSRTDPTDFRIHVSGVELPVRTMTIDEGFGGVTITIDEMFLINAGLGGAEDVEVEFTNWSAGATFTGDLSEVIGDINGCSGTGAVDGITAVCADPSGNWDPINADATFDLEISHRWGTLEPITIYPNTVIQQVPDLDPPTDIEVMNAGQDFVSLKWDEADVEEQGWYLWKRIPPASWERTNLEPIHEDLRHSMIEELQVGTVYDLGVSVIGVEGQESDIGSISTSTTLGLLNSNWPVVLDGGIGSAPAITDIDNDEDNEVIAATFSGSVFIVEADGSATRIYDSDYLLSGLAIGHVHPSSTRDEIVVSGWDYDAVDGKYCVVIVLKWNVIGGWTATEIEASSGGDQLIHEYLTVPVLINADNTGGLEIALRTFNGYYTGNSNSWLYVWRYDNGQWGTMTGFPRVIAYGESDYAAPVVIGDTDEDQYPELLLSAGIEKLLWVEPGTAQADNEWDLSDALPAGDWRLGFSYLVVVPEITETKIVGIACNQNGHIMTYCIATTDGGGTPGFVDRWESSGAVNIEYTYGDLGGPAVGDVDGDGYLEVVKQWDGDPSTPDYVDFRKLSNGDSNVLEDIPYNWHQEDYSMSSVVIAGDEGDGLAALYGISTTGQAASFDNDEPGIVTGFPVWTEDLVGSTPTVGNLDADAYLEVVFADNSGRLIALDWNVSASGSDDWPMLQHDLHRTGNFGFSRGNGLDTKLDFQVINVGMSSSSSIDDRSSRSNQIQAVVAISGVEIEETFSPHLTATSDQTRDLQIDSEPELTLVCPERELVEIANTQATQTLPVALYLGNRLLDVRRIPLVNGEQEVIFVSTGTSRQNNFFVVVDPFQEYPEVDEDNNIQEVGVLFSTSFEPDGFRVTSKDGEVMISIQTGGTVATIVDISLYSIDGRLVSSTSGELIPSVANEFNLQGADGPLPSGCYILTIDDDEGLYMTRKVIVLR